MTETTSGPQTDFELQDALLEALQCATNLSPGEDLDEFADEIAGPIAELGIRDASTFEEQMVLTQNAGIVLKLRNGREYQLTIVRSA